MGMRDRYYLVKAEIKESSYVGRVTDQTGSKISDKIPMNQKLMVTAYFGAVKKFYNYWNIFKKPPTTRALGIEFDTTASLQCKIWPIISRALKPMRSSLTALLELTITAYPGDDILQ